MRATFLSISVRLNYNQCTCSFSCASVRSKSDVKFYFCSIVILACDTLTQLAHKRAVSFVGEIVEHSISCSKNPETKHVRSELMICDAKEEEQRASTGKASSSGK